MDKTSYYDVVAPVYDTIVPRDVKGICDSLEDILKRYTRKRQVIDLGCGTGRFAIELAKRKYRVYGIDLSEQMLDIARKNAQRAHIRADFIKADMRNFTMPRKAGIAWARGSIGDLLRSVDTRQALLNARRNLMDQGFFVLDVRDLDQHVRAHGSAAVHDTRIFRRRNRTVTFRFILKLDRKTRIARVTGDVLVKKKQSSVRLKTVHYLRYFKEQELKRLLVGAGFKLLDILPGYPLERHPKPRLVAVAQRS